MASEDRILRSEMDAAGANVSVDLAPVREHRDMAESWRSLEARADCSFFQSWRWIGTWLAELPAGIEPLCIRARAGGETVGLALLTPHIARRHGLVTARQLHLNATGDPAHDRLTIEHNGFLIDRKGTAAVTAAIFRFLLRRPDLWEELALPGIAPSLAAAAGTLGLRAQVIQHSPCRYVDLAFLGDGAYLDYLDSEVRYQIRRAHRLYGEPKLERAGTGKAMEYLDGLIELHEVRWRAVGEAGAFASDFTRSFHRRLVAEGVPSGDVQLLRTRTGNGEIVGYLYNFVHRGRVYAYQSGFRRSRDNRLKPGLVSHHLAIEMNRSAGQRVYDFLAGDSRYKRDLSTHATELLWLVVQRPALKFALENGARTLRSLIRRRTLKAARGEVTR